MQEGHPITFISKVLSPRHAALSVYDRELLAIVQVVTKWSQYLLGQKFIIRTDQKALKFLMKQKLHTNSQLLWLTKLMPFDYAIEYKRRVDNKVADALSRVSGAELLALVVSPTGTDLFQAIVDSWSSDVELQQLITDLQTYPTTHKQFTWSQGHLRRKGKLVIGKDQSLRTEIMTLWHVGSQGGHSGVEATLKRLLTLFYWKHMRTDVFLDIVVKLHGLPETITSDRNVIFLSSFWQGLFTIHGVQLNTSTAYHPQSDGQTEVLNMCLETYLRCYCHKDASNWVACLSMAEYWYNTSYHSAIQTTPYEALYGRPPLLHLPYLPRESSSAEVDSTLVSRELKLQLLKHHLSRAQLRMKQQVDSHRSDRNFNILWRVGPVAYTLLLPSSVKIHPTVHVSLLKKCYEVPTHISYPPTIDLASPRPEPELVLQRRIVKQGSKAVAQVLVKWRGFPTENATWEFATVLKTRFPLFDP
ncbi:hypothetical protein KY285_016875 [Solanum tuberosum]|nr:hypothetical protein KY285_016875 [Solanum tuberosum]